MLSAERGDAVLDIDEEADQRIVKVTGGCSQHAHSAARCRLTGLVTRCRQGRHFGELYRSTRSSVRGHCGIAQHVRSLRFRRQADGLQVLPGDEAVRCAGVDHKAALQLLLRSAGPLMTTFAFTTPTLFSCSGPVRGARSTTWSLWRSSWVVPVIRPAAGLVRRGVDRQLRGVSDLLQLGAPSGQPLAIAHQVQKAFAACLHVAGSG